VNDVTVQCVDAFGTGTASRRVDRGIPSVAINSPSTGTSTSVSTAPVQLGVSNNGAAITTLPAGVTCSISSNGGTPVNQAANLATATNVPLTAGVNNLVATCTNASGTGTSQTVVVNYVAPVVTWFSPANNTTTTATSINLAYRVNSLPTIPAGTTCNINGTATTSATTNSKPLVVGTNTFTVTCNNAVGSTSAVLTITRT
jgi:hypothetical protein